MTSQATRSAVWKIKVIFFIAVIAIATSPLWWLPLTRPNETSGICIYKGAPFYAVGILGGTSSEGVPLRNINVTVYDYTNDYPNNVLTFGPTDRTGCFYFVVPYEWHSQLSYSYNGTKYYDDIQAGVVLGDHVP